MAEKTFPERFRVRVFEVLEWVLAHKGLLAGAVAGVVLAVAAGGVWWWQAERREGFAGMALMEVNQAFRQQYPAGFYLPSGEGGERKPDPLIQRYHQVADQFTGTRAGTEAILRAGHLEYSAGQYDAAIADYDRYGRDRQAPFRAAAFLGKGYALEAKGDVEGAVASFGLAGETAGRDPVGAEAFLAQGRALEALKKRDEALRIYGLVVERFPQSAWAARATERMSALR
jgi:tetratricopeptide (TPR) repeat protein